MLLESLGWSRDLQDEFAPLAAGGLGPGRVLVRARGRGTVACARGELRAEASGRLRHAARADGLAVAGDWVALRARPDVALAVLPRRSGSVRKDAGTGVAPQVVAWNLDVAFPLAALSQLNRRRLERYLAAASECGAEPAVVLTKADLAENPAAAVVQAAAEQRGRRRRLNGELRRSTR